jgi:hypothetical protein
MWGQVPRLWTNDGGDTRCVCVDFDLAEEELERYVRYPNCPADMTICHLP